MKCLRRWKPKNFNFFSNNELSASLKAKQLFSIMMIKIRLRVATINDKYNNISEYF